MSSFPTFMVELWRNQGPCNTKTFDALLVKTSSLVSEVKTHNVVPTPPTLFITGGSHHDFQSTKNERKLATIQGIFNSIILLSSWAGGNIINCNQRSPTQAPNLALVINSNFLHQLIHRRISTCFLRSQKPTRIIGASQLKLRNSSSKPVLMNSSQWEKMVQR
jgi:hypothetical protein